ncbi:DNA-directed RNA polymerase core subunit rpc10 [Saxophila tyrrhenica]|uniref:DNA-directed RNA polymerase core subunit rpc10 n=1 Tax=Saxophila tyrrhenica TaxID=1690608 RepID=A0AAV9NZM9_9PEZI|nr:DNA-directed RNA polymerase core subunit rpc10 [Saxophila tyrrhenica]
MSREAYTPQISSSQNPAPGASSTTNNTGGTFNITGASNTFEDTSRPVAYLCGDCDAKVTLKSGDAIRCKECGYRVLYKERTNRMIQFEAR